MATETLRYGIVGCGGIGRKHGNGVTGATGAELVACADIVEEAVRAFGEEFDCEPYADRVEMMREADVDAISVCTPNGAHAEVVEDAADLGVNVLCEKPLDLSVDRMDRMVDACDAAGVTFGGIFQNRTHTAIREARDAIESGVLGAPVLADVEAKWHRPSEYYDHPWHGSPDLDGGALISQAVHYVDLLQWLAGDVEEVTAYADTLVRDVEVIDTASVAVRFANGAFGSIEATVAIQPQQASAFALNGSEGSLSLRIGDHLTIEDADGETTEYGPDAFDGGHGVQIQDFVDALHERRDPIVTGEEARGAVEIVLAAHASAERGERVPVAEFRR